MKRFLPRKYIWRLFKVLFTKLISNLILQSWTKVLGHFCYSGAFSNSHRFNPTPHPTNNVGHVYPVSTLYRVWRREYCEKFLKRMHCFKREPRNDRKIWMLQYCPKDFCLGLIVGQIIVLKIDVKKQISNTIITQAYSRCSSWKLSSKARITWDFWTLFCIK